MITLKLTKKQARTLRQAIYSAIQNEEALIDAHAPQYGVDHADFKRLRTRTQKIVDEFRGMDALIIEKLLEGKKK